MTDPVIVDVTQAVLNGEVDILAEKKQVRFPNEGYFHAWSDHDLVLIMTEIGSAAAQVIFVAGTGLCSPLGDLIVSVPADSRMAICLESSRFCDTDGDIDFIVAAGEVEFEALRLPRGL